MHPVLRNPGLIPVLFLATIACHSNAERQVPASGAADSALAQVVAVPNAAAAVAPDSSWVVVAQPTIVAFHPLATNEQLEADEGLATALDDLAYHLGTAMDSLVARGFVVRYQPGDTVKLLPAAVAPYVFVRDRDSADVGYVFADTVGRRAIIYGVRSHLDLIGYAETFLRTGTLPSTP